MTENQGWIALHRSILDWQWYHDPSTRLVFIHLLVKANHKEKKVGLLTIKRGQLLTSRSKLAAEICITERQLRTSLNKLKATNEVTIETTSNYSIITITNYNKFQSNDQQSDQAETNERPSKDQAETTNNNETMEQGNNGTSLSNPKDQNNIEKGGMGGKTKADFSKYEKRDFAKLNQKPKRNLNDPELTMRFETFWNAYPKQANKKFALEAFAEALTLSDFQTILDSAERFKKYHREQSTEMKFIKSPDKWLSGEHWRDKLMLKEEIEYLEKIEADRKYEENQALLKKMIEESKQKKLNQKENRQ